MFNENEIAVFACVLDHVDWKYDEVVPKNEDV